MKTKLTLAVLSVAALTTAGPVHAANCQWVAAAGSGPSVTIATVMSTHGLENIIEGKGLKGQGPVQTKCTPGTVLTECRSQQKACK